MAGASGHGRAWPGAGDPARTPAPFAWLAVHAAAAGTGRAWDEQVESRVTVAASEAVVQPGDLPAVMLGLLIQIAEQESFEPGQT
jgi:hypothetical protein